jgi:hypothetical protein
MLIKYHIYILLLEQELLQTNSNPEEKKQLPLAAQRVKDTPLELNIPFSKAEPTYLSLAAVLGFLNLIGVVVLDGIIKTPALLAQSKYILLVSKIYPLLVLYAAAYTAIPVVRSLRLLGENKGIKKRNARRQQWLNHCASEQLQMKFVKACELAVDMAEQRKAQLQALTDLNKNL